MKKIITMCLVYAMVWLCIMPVGGVFAETPDLLFDLNIATGEGGTLCLSDASGSGLITTVETVGQPTLKTLDTGKAYLELATYDETSGKWTNSVGSEVLATFDADSVNITDKTAVTFETWARGNYLVNDSGSWDQLFEFGDGASNAISLEIGKAYYFGFYPDRKQSNTAYAKLNNVTGYNEKWTHYVFVRNWDSVNSKWVITMYVNGEAKSVELSNAIKEVNARGDYSDSTYNKLTIGGTATSNKFSFRGDISAFKVYDGVLSAEDVASKYADEKNQYIEFADTFTVTEVSQTEENISVSTGEISLKFDNYVDEDTIKDGIKFTKASGEPISGGVQYEKHTDEFGYVNSVTLKFGTLESGEDYKLSVTENLMSLNKIACEAYEKIYKAKNFEIFEDFSGDEYIVGEKPSDDSERGITYKDGEANGKTTITSVMEENGDKFVRIDPNGVKNQGATIQINFAEPLKYSVLGVDLKIRPYADAGETQALARELLKTGFAKNKTGDSFANALGTMVNGNIKPASSADTRYFTFDDSSKDVVFTNDKTDENGFYDIRVVFKRDENDNVNITIKNLNDIEAAPITATMTLNWEEGKINYMTLAHCWVTSTGAGNSGNYMDISEFHIRTLVETDVISTDIDALEHTNSEFSVAFSNDMNEDSLAALKVLNKNGVQVATEFLRYDESLRAAYYKLGEYLNYNDDYILSLDKVYDKLREPLSKREIAFKSASNEAKVTSISFKDGAGQDITSLEGVETAKLSMQVYNDGLSTKYFNFAMIVYDEDGRIVKMLQKPEDIDAVVASGKSKTLEIDSAGITLESGYSIKAIAWHKDALKGAISFMKPVELY